MQIPVFASISSPLTAGERTRHLIRSITRELPQGILHSTTESIAEPLLELLDILLVRRRDLTDLVYKGLLAGIE